MSHTNGWITMQTEFPISQALRKSEGLKKVWTSEWGLTDTSWWIWGCWHPKSVESCLEGQAVHLRLTLFAWAMQTNGSPEVVSSQDTPSQDAPLPTLSASASDLHSPQRALRGEVPRVAPKAVHYISRDGHDSSKTYRPKFGEYE